MFKEMPDLAKNKICSSCPFIRNQYTPWHESDENTSRTIL